MSEDAFVKEAEQLRRELLAYCYRLTGSVQDAEDLVQEAMLRGWRSYARFRGEATVRSWLYRIATNAFLSSTVGAGTCRLISAPGYRRIAGRGAGSRQCLA